MNSKTIRVSVLIVLLTLTGCVADKPEISPPPPPEAETETVPESPPAAETPYMPPEPPHGMYTKLTENEAREKMQETGVILLDVRTREEYDEAHLPDAILLPNSEIKAQAETVFPDKAQTILVYCRAGVRSELASKELIRLGYTNVFDIGGIMAWSAIPFTYTTTTSIHTEMPAFEFCLEGILVAGHDPNEFYYGRTFTQISALTVTGQDGMFRQAFTDLHTNTEDVSEQNMYGLSFDDWNFDGYLDIGLWAYPGGSMRNNPHYYWLWDHASKQFVRNSELEEISDVSEISVYPETKRLACYTRYGTGTGISRSYEYIDGHFLLVYSSEVTYFTDENDQLIQHIVIQELIDGELVTTESFEPL